MKVIQATSKQGQRYIASYVNSTFEWLEGTNKEECAYLKASETKQEIWENIINMIHTNNTSSDSIRYGIPYIISHNSRFFTVAFAVYPLTENLNADLRVITPTQDILIKEYIVDGVIQV